MQTFLPYDTFEASLRCLDNVRFVNQMRETKTLLSANLVGNGWSNHPAAVMWLGYEDALTEYLWVNAMMHLRRGGNIRFELPPRPRIWEHPWWLGTLRFHIPHQKALLAKDHRFYKKYDWVVLPEIAYEWPGGKSLQGIWKD